MPGLFTHIAGFGLFSAMFQVSETNLLKCIAWAVSGSSNYFSLSLRTLYCLGQSKKACVLYVFYLVSL